METQWLYFGKPETGIFVNKNKSDKFSNKLEINQAQFNTTIIKVLIEIDMLPSLNKSNIALSTSCNLKQTVKLVVNRLNLEEINNLAKWLMNNILTMTMNDVVRFYDETGICCVSEIKDYCTVHKHLGPFAKEVMQSSELTQYFAKFFLHINPEITYNLLKHYPRLDAQLKAEAEYYVVLNQNEPGEDKNRRLLQLAYQANLEVETRCHFIEISGADLSHVHDLNVLDPIDILLKYASIVRY